jgi:hypothetical protein
MRISISASSISMSSCDAYRVNWLNIQNPVTATKYCSGEGAFPPPLRDFASAHWMVYSPMRAFQLILHEPGDRSRRVGIAFRALLGALLLFLVHLPKRLSIDSTFSCAHGSLP